MEPKDINLTVDGINVHCRESSEGPPVVLLHGGGSSGAQWRKVCEALGGYRTITVDHYGHGGTDPWPGPAEQRTHEAEAALVQGVIEHAGEPAHVVGHSYGGGVALRLVVESPRFVRSLALVEPIALSMLGDGDAALREEYRAFALGFIKRVDQGRIEEAWQEFIDGNSEPGAWGRLNDAARERFQAGTQAVYSGWYANLSHATAPVELAALPHPALLMHGTESHARFRRMAEVIAETIPGARLHSLPGAGHMSPLTHPQPLAEALAAHFEKH